MDKKLIFLLPTLSSVLLIFSYPPYNIKFLSWVALVPLLIFVNFDLTKKKIFLGGFLTGLIFFGGTLRWLLSSHPLDWMGIGNVYLSFVLAAANWLVMAGFMALFFGFFSSAFSWLKTKTWLDLFLAPGLWIIFEYLRAWGFNFLYFGPGTLWGAHYTLGDLGYSLVNSGNFLQLAGFTGVLGLGFLAVFINFVIFKILKGSFKRNNLIFFVVFFTFLISLNFYGLHLKTEKEKQTDKKVPIALIQGNFPSQFYYTFEERRQNFLAYLQLVKEAAVNPSNPQIIILPEDTRFFTWLKKINPEPDKFLKELFNGQKKLLITSGRTEDADGQIKSIMTYYDTQKGIVGQYQKRFLMPIGEYLPYWLNGLAQFFGKKDWVDDFNASRGYSKGNQAVVAEADWGKISGLMCSGVLSPELNRELADKGAEFLVFLSSNGSFRGVKPLLAQILATAQVREVENNRYLAQSANKGWSYIIDPAGQIKEKNFSLGTTIIYGKISFLSGESFYTRYGDWILILAAILVLVQILSRKNIIARTNL